MTVGIARITLFLPASQSLKDKRAVLRRLKALVRDKFTNAAMAEVGENELWQRAALGVAVVGGDRAFTESVLDELLRFVEGHADVTHTEREFHSYNKAFGVGVGVEHWNG
jgi:uncharacterized protein YlxP (DUF503 family)